MFFKKQVLEVPNNVINKYKKIVNIIFHKIFKRKKIKQDMVWKIGKILYWQAEI